MSVKMSEFIHLKGWTTLSNLDEFNLSSTTWIQEILLSLDTIIMDPLDKNLIYSKEYRLKQKQVILNSFLNAKECQTPFYLKDLECFDKGYLFQSLIEDYLSELISLGKIKGLYFVPFTYFDKLNSEFVVEFTSFGYIEFEEYVKKYLENPSLICKQQIPDCLLFTHCAMTRIWIKEFSIEFIQKLETYGWMYQDTVLPPVLTDSEKLILIKEMKQLVPSFDYESPFLISKHFKSLLLDKLHIWIDSKAQEIRSSKKKSASLTLEELISYLDSLIESNEHSKSNKEQEFKMCMAKSLLSEMNSYLSTQIQSIFKVSNPSKVLKLDEKFQIMYTTFILYESGLQKFKGTSLGSLLSKYLLETKGMELYNGLLESIPSNNQVKELLDLLKREKMNDFILELEKIGLLKPSQEEMNRIIKVQTASLKTQLDSTLNDALFMHIVLVLLFIKTHPQTLLHMSGKLIPKVLEFLKDKLHVSEYDYLKEYQEKIILKVQNHKDLDLSVYKRNILTHWNL